MCAREKIFVIVSIVSIVVLLPQFQIGFVHGGWVSVPPYDEEHVNIAEMPPFGPGTAQHELNKITGVMRASALISSWEWGYIMCWAKLLKNIDLVAGETMEIYYSYWIKGLVKASLSAWAYVSLYIKVWDPFGNELDYKELFGEEAWFLEEKPIDDSEVSQVFGPWDISSSGEYTVEAGLIVYAEVIDTDYPGSAISDFLQGDNYAKVTMNIHTLEPETFDLFVEAVEDQGGNPLVNGDVYIDGQLVGNTHSSFTVPMGTHTVFVNDWWTLGGWGYRYGFDHWQDGSTDPTRTIEVSEDMVITAWFHKKYCPGDVDGNGIVDIVDVVLVSLAFGSTRNLGDPLPPGDWDSRADQNRDGIIDIVDITTVAINFGNEYPDP